MATSLNSTPPRNNYKRLTEKQQKQHPLIALSWPRTWLKMLLLLFALPQFDFLVGAEHVLRDYNSGQTLWDSRQNVSCIAHDAKFTCDCQNVNQHLQLPHLVGAVYQVEISNCKSLTIEANILQGTQGLRKINFKNIENLVLREYALDFPPDASNAALIVEFEKVNFELIDSHAINGNIEEISFIGGRIDVINSFGFTTVNNGAQLLKLDNVLVKHIKAQAFKKFAINEIVITNCAFTTNVPSRAFYDLEVRTALRIHNVNFKEVHSHAFSLIVNELIITNNYFEAVEGEWIKADVRKSVIIRENNFGLTSPIAFKGITVHRDYVHSERLELRFNNNTVRFALEPRPLEFNDQIALNLKYLQYENEYNCRELDTAQNPPQPKQAFFRSNIDNIYFRNTQEKNTATSSNSNRQSFVVLSKIIESGCQKRSYLLYIILGVVALVLLFALIAVIVWLQVAKRRKRRKMDIVMPEPRTYKETQIVYQIENAGLLKTDL